jgi:hypothetical protein
VNSQLVKQPQKVYKNSMDKSLLIVVIVLAAITVIKLISMWAIFAKAGQPGFYGIIPIVNIVIFMAVIRKPWWWLFLWMIPAIGLIWRIWGWNLMVKRFGKTEDFTVGIILLPFIYMPVLAFGDSKFSQSDEQNDERESEKKYIRELIEKSGGEGDSVVIKDRCPACGTNISGDDKQCPDCGLNLT